MVSLAQASQAIFQFAGVQTSLFPPNSRYNGVATASFTPPGGQPLAYLRRRFVPPASAYALLLQHTVTQGERVDTIANNFLGDPLLFWRLCDANTAMRPEELETPGRVLAITLPQGLPGPPQNA